MNQIKKLYNLYRLYKNGSCELSFSQFGEDVIILKKLEKYNIRDITYLDIGAHHPINLSNTYSFYLRGSRGLLIEPNPFLVDRLRYHRKEDKILNIGIGLGKTEKALFYLFKDDVLSTFSKEECKKYEEKGHELKEIVEIDLFNINDVISDSFKECPHIISIDVEGQELGILKSFDFQKLRPKIFCVETWSYANTKKETEIIEFLNEKGYVVTADTTLNTIFQDIKI